MDQKRSIQDIIPPARSKPIRPGHVPVRPENQTKSGDALPPKRSGKPQKIKNGKQRGLAGLFGIALVVIVVVGGAFGVVSTLFHRADITLSLKTFTVPIADSFIAFPDTSTPLSYEKRTISLSLDKTVPRSGSESVEERASGTITIFNAYSKSSQRLITNTRFETPDGLIFRIQSSVVVPGYTTVNGEIVPGKLEARVFADEPGEQYNIGISDFTIPGLKGSAQYDSMYARSQAAIGGGFVGEKAVVSPEIRDAAIADLRSELDRAVRAQMLGVAGDGIFFPDTISVTFIENPDKSIDDGALISLTAEAEAPIFDQDQLARAIAEKGNVPYENALSLENISELAIQATPSETDDSITLTISGTTRLVASYDQNRLLRDLAGKDQRTVGTVLSAYPAIADMKISVYPFWRGVLPRDVSRLTVKTLRED